MPIRKSNDTLFYLIGIIPVVWLALLLAQSLGGGLPELLRNLTRALEQPTNIVWTNKSLPTILICLAAYGMAVLLYRTNQGRTRDGEEHGSAAWATPASVNAQFAQKDSIPLTQHVRLGLDTHKHRRSLNVLVIGGSGAAKTRSFVLPNILTANTNYVITDPKSEVLLATGGYLKEQGYDVRVLNLVNLEQSDGYNPFRYLRDEKDVLKLVNNLIQSTTPKGSHESDPFWTKAETALLQAIILMLFQEAPEYEQNFSMVMRVLEYAEVREEDEGHVSPLDLLFESIERRKPDSVAVRQYKVFKLAAGVVCSKRLLNQAVGKSLRTHNLKSKKGAQVMRKNEKITALYERLSRDDFGKDDDQQRESNSISNQELICKGWFLPPNTYDCGSFVVNGTAVVGKEPKHSITAGNQHTKELTFMKSLFEQMGGTYHQVGDYLIPNLSLPEESDYQIGKYGRMRRSYLKEYHPVLYANYLTSGTLHRHLAEIDQACHERMEIVVSAMAKQEGVIEALKAADQMEWVRRMNSIHSRAEEIVLTELVYA